MEEIEKQETESNPPETAADPGNPEGAQEEHRHRHRHRRTGTQCPKCGSTRVRRSHDHGNFETVILPLLFRRWFRCKACNARFQSFFFEWAIVKKIVLAIGALGLAAILLFGVWKMIESLAQPSRPPESPALRTPASSVAV